MKKYIYLCAFLFSINSSMAGCKIDKDGINRCTDNWLESFFNSPSKNNSNSSECKIDQYGINRCSSESYNDTQNSFVQSSEALLTKGYNKALAGNYGEAYRILEPLASQGYAEAQFNLGMMFQNGGSGLQKNNASSAYWFNLAANQGDQSSQFELAGIYYRGLGVKKDLKIAKYWAKLASQGSNPIIASRSREFLKNQMSWWEKQKLGASSIFGIFSGN